MKVSNKKRAYVSLLWFKSALRNSKPNLVIKYTECGSAWNKNYFTIGTYFFNSITGMDHVNPLPGMEKLSYDEVINLLK